MDRVSGDDDLPTDRQDTRSRESQLHSTAPASPKQLAQLEHRDPHELQAQASLVPPKPGRYVVARGEIFVRAGPSASAEKQGMLDKLALVTITSVEFNDKDGWVWGCLSEPEGWIPVLDVKLGRSFAREASAEEAAVDPPRVRSLPFGSTDTDAGASGGASSLRQAAMDDLERIFSGLMPVARTEPLEGAEEGDATGLRPMCASCAACCNCNCRRGCDKP